MTYLLDSDTVIFLIRGWKAIQRKPNATGGHAEKARRIRLRHQAAGHEGVAVGVSVITLCELAFGVRKSEFPEREKRAVAKILAPFRRFPLPATGLPEHYAELRHRLETAGRSIGQFDLLIAAHALDLDATLVTNNQAHFRRIPGLRVENWTRKKS